MHYRERVKLKQPTAADRIKLRRLLKELIKEYRNEDDAILLQMIGQEIQDICLELGRLSLDLNALRLEE